LARRALIEGGEDEALVELARLVEPAVIVEAATEKALASRRRGPRVGEPDVRVELDPLPVGVQVVPRILELALAAQRSAGVTDPADHVLLLVEPDAVPELHMHTDDADDLVGASRGPGGLAGAGPHELLHQRRIVGRRVRGTVSEREQVPGVVLRCRSPCGAREAVDRPAQLQRSTHGPQQLPKRVNDGVPVMGADLQQDVAVALCRIEIVDRERRHRRQLVRARRGEPVALVEERRAEGDGDGQGVRRVVGPQGPGISRGGVDLQHRDRPARRQLVGALAERSQRRDQGEPIGGERVERGECRMRRHRREDPGLMLPGERLHGR
jgi:hypothetical protein